MKKTGLLFGLTFVVSFFGVGAVPQAIPWINKVTAEARSVIQLDRPQTVKIPKLGVVAQVEQVGVVEDGRMDVPKDVWNVGWYKHGKTPGERGNAVVAGHLDSETGPAVFARLMDLTQGDRVLVKNRIGKEFEFEVVKTATYPDKDFPLEQVFEGDGKQKNLQLITCRGRFDRETQEYSDRLVVYTRLVE